MTGVKLEIVSLWRFRTNIDDKVVALEVVVGLALKGVAESARQNVTHLRNALSRLLPSTRSDRWCRFVGQRRNLQMI